MIAQWLLLLTLVTSGWSRDPPVKIAIVGGGIGGTASAHFIRKKFGPDVEIWLYEESTQLGGRLAAVNMAEEGESEVKYEVGGTIIHPRNRLMVSLTSDAGLRARPPNPNSRMTIFDEPGGTSLYQEYFNYDWLNKLQLLLTYGYYSLNRVDKFVKHELEHFEQAYSYLDNGQHWKTVEDMLRTMSPTQNPNEAVEQTKVTLRKFLEDNGVSKAMIDELVTVALRVNYGQMPSDVHAFLGAVSLAGVEGDLWSIEGGNYQLPEVLFLNSGANLVAERVRSIYQDSTGQYVLRTDSKPEARFDIVIVAAPQTMDMNPMDLANSTTTKFPGKYHKIVATLVKCQGLKADYFNVDSVTDGNFFVSSGSNVNSIVKKYPVNAKDPDLNVYKILSQSVIQDSELNDIFENPTRIQRVPWLAFPHYTANETPLMSFKLSERLYYVNGIEWAASAMEMSALGAKNVANYAYNDWFSVKPKGGRTVKTEL